MVLWSAHGTCLLVLLCLWSLAAGLFSCDSGNLTSVCVINGPHVISNQSTSIEGNALIISSNGSLSCSSLQCIIQVVMEGEVTVLGTITAGYIQISAPQVSIGVSGILNASGMGYGSGQGPGAGRNISMHTASGGSYGGFSMPILDNSSLPYGSFAEPIDFGSGGGNSGDDLGGAGGGVIFINTTELFIFGQLRADGEDAQTYAGGGSGGSVHLNAASMGGSGQVSTNGGGSALGGLGSGGRIGVHNQNTTTPLQLALSSFGDSKWSFQAGAGTIYFSGNDTIIIDNNVTASTLNNIAYTGGTPVSGAFISAIVVKNSGVLIPADGNIYCNSLSLVHRAVLACVSCPDEGSIVANATIDIDVYSIFQLAAWWSITATNMTLRGTIYGAGVSLAVTQDLIISGSVNTNGRGLGPALGPGAGGSGIGTKPGGGAGHGAVGMRACAGDAAGGDAYDSDILPSDYGSGGGNAGPLFGGAGGGIIVITATNLTFVGSLYADGLQGTNALNITYPNGAGGGSGGSISVQCDRLYMGTSDISADGGTGGVMYYPIGSSGGGGAGGRVYFALNTVKIASASDISITALGGDTGCASSSNPGTVVTQCSPGYYSSNLFTCQGCPMGQYSTDGALCLDCPEGTSTNGLTAQTSCEPCIPGHYSQFNGSGVCSRCPAGYYANETGQTYCNECEPGYTTNEMNAQTECTACPPGTMRPFDSPPSFCTQCYDGWYSNQSAQTECEQCPYGYTSVNGSTACQACGPGSYSTLSYCYYCYPGSYSNATANVACTACAQGSFQSLSNGTQCHLCPPGTSSIYGATSCYSCSPGTFNNVSGGQCLRCPPFSYQPGYREKTCIHCDNEENDGTSCGDSSDGDQPLFVVFIAVPVFLVSILILAACCSYRRSMRRHYQRIQEVQPPRATATVPQIPPIPPPLPPAINDSPSEPAERECIICCDQPKDTVLLPCGHLASCETCTRALLASKPLCPCCRKTILSFVRV